MSLSQRHRNPNPKPVSFSLSTLAQTIETETPEVVFALLMGSTAGERDSAGDYRAADTCTVAAHSDLDIAVYLGAPAALRSERGTPLGTRYASGARSSVRARRTRCPGRHRHTEFCGSGVPLRKPQRAAVREP